MNSLMLFSFITMPEPSFNW